MLSRVASELYWMGRHLERAEHIARYCKVQYFGSLDAPLSLNKDFALSSILNMTGIEYEAGDLDERWVLGQVAFNDIHGGSILSSVKSGRECARGARDFISTELWEGVNRYYYFVNSYSQEYYQSQGLYDFSQAVAEKSYAVKGAIDNALLQDTSWHFIQIGLHLERVVQVARCMISKINDIEIVRLFEETKSLEHHQWMTLLRSVEAADMLKRVCNKPPTSLEVLNFLLLDYRFPRSIYFNLVELKKYVDELSDLKVYPKDSTQFAVGKIRDSFKYMEIKGKDTTELKTMLNQIITDIYAVSDQLVKEYLQY